LKSEETHLIKQLKHLTGSGKLVVFDGLVPLRSIVQPQVTEKKLEPMAGHGGTVDRVGVSSPQFLK
jgi:hypothetical protein